MMFKLYYFILSLFLFCCTKTIKEIDIKIIDPTITSIYEIGIDSVVVLTPLDHVVMKDSIINLLGKRIVSLNSIFAGYKIYDGKSLIKDKIFGWMGPYILYKYNKKGYLISKNYDTDFIAKYKVTTKFFPHKKQLKQYWYIHDHIDTTTYTFNDDAILIKENGHFHDDKSHNRKYEKSYHYNDKIKLIRTNTAFQNDYDDLQSTIETFEYVGEIIRKSKKTSTYGLRRRLVSEKAYETKFYSKIGTMDSLINDIGEMHFKSYFLNYKNGIQQN